jgi:rod shape determining protein RodA
MKFRPRITETRREGPVEYLSNLSRRYDFLQIGVILALLTISFLFIYTIGDNISRDNAMRIIWRQVWWVAVGGGSWFLAANIDYREFKVISWLFYAVCIVLLILVLEVGLTIQGATRWLSLPGGLRLQPSEFTKLALVMTISTSLTMMNFSVNRFFHLMLILVLTAVPFLLIMKEPDLGSAMILAPVTLTLIFVGGLKWRYILLGAVLISLAVGAVVLNEYKEYYPLLKPYQKKRIITFLNPEHDLQGSGLNQLQARLAVGSGGFWGKGIGKGMQSNLGFLPRTVANNDFIFSVIAEETGFAGCLALLSLYSLLFYSILRSALMAADDFGKYLGAGVAAIFFVHTYVNIGMSIGLAPITGLSLPLISYGGSFIVVSLTCLGLMQSIYRHGLAEAQE